MAPVGWRLSPDRHMIKSSSAGSEQKLLVLLSPQMDAKLGEALLMSIVTQRELWSRGSKAGTRLPVFLFPLEQPCSGRSVGRMSFTITPLELCS